MIPSPVSSGGRGPSLACLCLTAPTIDGAKEQLERCRDRIDMAELRADLLAPSERMRITELPATAGPGIPLILTARLPEDGGAWGNAGESEDDREAFLVSRLESGGWSYVDLEHDRPLERVTAAASASGCRIIRSRHDFSGKLLSFSADQIAGEIRKMAVGGAIAKFAAACTSSRGLLMLARAAAAAEDVEDKVILGMEEFGTPSRILAQRLGSVWTYVSVTDHPGDPAAAAPGQISPEILQDFYRFGDITDTTPLYGIAGRPIGHSRSPEIHNGWLRDAGLPGTYVPFLTDDLEALLEVCDAWGVSGLSVTVPHKETALAAADRVEGLARSIGAANTMVRTDGGWNAYNTDASGFLAPLCAAMGLDGAEGFKGLRAAVIGAGGAARAAVHALSNSGVGIVVLNRTLEKAEKLAREVDGVWGPLGEEALPLLDGIDIAVQTTSVGMHPRENADPAPWWDFSGCSLVYDMIYSPEETRLLRRARESGINTLNGSRMLEAQARLQFALFTGHEAPQPVIGRTQ